MELKVTSARRLNPAGSGNKRNRRKQNVSSWSWTGIRYSKSFQVLRSGYGALISLIRLRKTWTVICTISGFLRKAWLLSLSQKKRMNYG